MKKVLKILLGLVGTVAVILVAFGLFINFKDRPTYPVQDPNWTVEVTPEKVVQGQKLVTMMCSDCHSGDQTPALVGKRLLEVNHFGEIYSRNITNDPEVGIGKWTDGQIAYAIRTGIRPDGVLLSPPMPQFPLMSDEDIESVIAYLRSDHPNVQANKQEPPDQNPNFLAKALMTFAFQPEEWPEQPIKTPHPSNQVAFGKYLVTSRYLCFECHSASMETLVKSDPEQSEGYLAGGTEMLRFDGVTPVMVPNITLHPDGLGSWSKDQFAEAVRFGRRPNGKPMELPMPKMTNVTDEEVDAIYAYLQTVPVSDNLLNQPTLAQE